MDTHTQAPLKILLYNVGYYTELDGSVRDYLFRGYRYLYTPKKVVSETLQQLNTLMEQEKPDICCFIEIHKNKRNRPLFSAYHFGDIDNKYGFNSVLRRLPFFRNNCNGFFSKKALNFHKHYFKSGTKKLVYEIELQPNVSLFMVHFSLKASTRKKQFEELKAFLDPTKQNILCGDFNTFSDTQELDSFARSCGLRIVNKPSEGTFPAKDPRKAIDLFLCSATINAGSEVLNNVQLSDHLPVLAHISIQTPQLA
jgi:endonuclease/exonuclease/phosphatase (EEP) superfamily protein YafD